MDSSQTIREQLRKRRRRKFWHMVRLLVSTAILAVTCTYVWRYVHNPAFAFGNVSIHGSSQLTEAEVISLAGCGQGPLNLFNASSGRLREALLHDVRFKNAEVAYRFPATLQVSVEERQPALYVANSYHSYLKVDYNGVVLSVTTTIPDAKAPVLAGIECGNLYLGDKVANAGVLLTRVEYLKEGEDRHFAIVDAAMNDLIRPSLYGAWMNIIPADKSLQRPACRYDVVGPVCETGDFLGKDRELSLAQGDLLVVRSAGAYGFSMSSNYNARPRAAEVLVDGDTAHLVRQREPLADLWRLEQTLP